ncbi:hypothetical protein EUGRSUZ_G01112 [Eucalyptus grandis]|uniref:Uncharacterized protein n=2 Tax=Eucalyptus grandis TaxID=71139 RepID=A0ACC3K2L9_EUCGR|nr:hypothetical protein EUGRSUZ_G01112 [Eucalyptus grandis]
MASAPSKLYADDVSLLVVLLDANPFFWSASSLPFSKFISHVISFLNSVLLLNQLNQIVVIATGHNCCDYVYDSSSPASRSAGTGKLSALSVDLLEKLEEFVCRDEKLLKKEPEGSIASSLLSGSLSMALCYIQRVFRSGPRHPHPRILCLHGSQDGPEQYVAIMNAIFSAQRSMVPIDSCFIGAQNSAFLQQASYITGGVYLKPQLLEGTFQYLSFLALICILVDSCNCLSPLVLIFAHRAFVTKKLLTWATSVLYACLYSASTTRNVQPVDLFLVSPTQRLPQNLTRKERREIHKPHSLYVCGFFNEVPVC